jgi:hypothetical protein
VQLGSAEKVAVTTHVLPFATPVKLKFAELPKGALKTCDPPQEFVKVSVPEAGALVKLIVPVMVYWFVAASQLVIFPVKLPKEQGVALHGAGAV